MKCLLTVAVALMLVEGVAEAQCRGRMGGGRLLNRGGCNQGQSNCGPQGCGQPIQFMPTQAPCTGPNCPIPAQQAVPAAPIAPKGEAAPAKEGKAEAPTVSLALIEVNETRRLRGLRPFVECPLLTRAARACASIRASRFIEGHIDDFAHLPPGANAAASGCAAWPEGMGWGSCCTYDHYTYAGAAWVTGSDGRRYMHLFVR